MADDRGNKPPESASDPTATSATGGDAGTMDASLAARITRSDAQGASMNDEEPEAWAAGTPKTDAELGTGVMGRGEDLLTKGETHGRADDPGLPLEDDNRGPRRG